MALSDQLASHITQTRYEDLPDAVVSAAKRLILDTIGTAYAGAGEPGCAEMMDAVRADGGGSQSTIWFSGEAAPAAAAALVNGTCAAALDYDSLHFESVVHPEIVTVPAAIALAEREGCSGRDLIRAVVIGGDLMCRLALSTDRNSAWFVTSTNGTFGAAAAAAVVMGLDHAATRNALGLALCQASGTVQAVFERTLAKRMLSAFAARNGMFSAELARRGVTGPVEAFEGTAGYYAAFEPGDPKILMDGLGKRFETANTGIKKFPSCACNHAAIEAALRLSRAHRLDSADIRKIRVRLTPYMAQVVGAPFDPTENPQVAAQFSVQYSLACALTRGSLGLQDLTTERVREPGVGALARRVEIEIDQTNNGFVGPATVFVETGSGKFEESVAAVPGSAESPLSDAEVVEKFNDCIRYGSARQKPLRGDILVDAVSRLESVDNIRGLFQAAYGNA